MFWSFSFILLKAPEYFGCGLVVCKTWFCLFLLLYFHHTWTNECGQLLFAFRRKAINSLFSFSSRPLAFLTLLPMLTLILECHILFSWTLLIIFYDILIFIKFSCVLGQKFSKIQNSEFFKFELAFWNLKIFKFPPLQLNLGPGYL